MVRPIKRLLLFGLILAASLVPAGTAGATVGFTSSALSVGGTPLDVAVGDLDGRNGPDIVTSLTDGSLAVQLNNGNGTFAAPHPYPAGCPAFQVELGDLVTTGASELSGRAPRRGDRLRPELRRHAVPGAPRR